MWTSFALALRILTSVPGIAVGQSDRFVFKRAVILFPLVGAIIGAVAGAVWMLCTRLWIAQPFIAAVFAVLASTLITAARGADGVGRMADATASYAVDEDRAKAVAVLRDSRRNGAGIAAVTIAVVLKVVLIAGLRPEIAWQSLIVAGTLGQWAAAFAFTIFRMLPAWNNADDESSADRAAGLNEFMPAMMLAILGAAVVPVNGVIALTAVGIVAGPLGKSLDQQFGGLNVSLAHAIGMVGELVALATLAIKM